MKITSNRRTIWHCAGALPLALAALGLTSCATDGLNPAASKPVAVPHVPHVPHVANQPADSCTALAAAAFNFPVAKTAVTAARFNTVTDALPEHCQVDGLIDPRTGVDGKPYAIKFRLRLPTRWNGRFYMGGGGGTNGNLIDPVAVMKLGYATVGTDSGHDNATNTDPNAGGTAAFGVDPKARTDFAADAYDQVTRTGKALTVAFYGAPVSVSYFEGCSEGGREALLMSQRFPQHYDGIVAGAPTLHLPLGPMAGIHTTQLFAGLASRAGHKLPNGQPAIGQSFSDPDLALVRKAVLSACDALDGLADGIVDNLPACTTPLVHAQLVAAQCTGAKTASCLSADQISTLEKAYAGATDSKGKALYSDWPWDPGMSAQSQAAPAGPVTFNQSWRSWWLGAPSPTANNAIKLNFVSAIAVAYSSTPRLPFGPADALPFSLSYNFDTDVEKIYSRSAPGASPFYSKSAAELYFTDVADLSALHARGGKLMVYHGAADSAISVNDTLRWYSAVGAAMGKQTQDFARMYVVPGMNHCRGGPATDRFDMLAPLVDWVEKGVAPDRVLAHASTPAFFNTGTRSRPLCPHPQQSRYKGTGSIDEAGNFECK